MFVDKYRPTDYKDYVADPKTVAAVRALVSCELSPAFSNNIMFYGSPGTGKTTLANLLMKEVDAECLKTQKPKWIVLDEADQLLAKAQLSIVTGKHFAKLSDECRGLARILYLVNRVSNMIEPLMSQCAPVRFAPLNPTAQVEKLRGIATLETPLKFDAGALRDIARLSRGDMRHAINSLQIAASIATAQDQLSFRPSTSSALQRPHTRSSTSTSRPPSPKTTPPRPLPPEATYPRPSPPKTTPPSIPNLLPVCLRAFPLPSASMSSSLRDSPPLSTPPTTQSSAGDFLGPPSYSTTLPAPTHQDLDVSSRCAPTHTPHSSASAPDERLVMHTNPANATMCSDNVHAYLSEATDEMVADIVETIRTQSYTFTVNHVRTRLAENGLSVSSILGRMLDRLITNQIKMRSVTVKLTLIGKMADIELALTQNASERIQLCALIGAWKTCGL